MKKIIQIGGLPIIVGCCIAAFSMRGQSKLADDLLLANVEAISSGGDAADDPFKDCPRTEYNINERETWIQTTAQYESGFGLYIRIKGKKVQLGAEAKVGGTVFYPDCVNSNGNCCKKSHLDKNFRYV